MRYILFLLILIFISCNKQDDDTLNKEVDTLNKLEVDILINASKGGGVWWYPQYPDYNPNLPHQGKSTVDSLKSYEFSVYEIGRGEFVDMNDYHVSGLLIIPGSYRTFSDIEIQQILDFLNSGGNLLILVDHNPKNSLTHALNLDFQPINFGGATVEYESHPISEGLEPNMFLVGVSAITNSEEGINVIARLEKSVFIDTNGNNSPDPGEISNPIFMGTKTFGKGRIVFCGDINLWQHDFLLLKNTLKWFDLM